MTTGEVIALIKAFGGGGGSSGGGVLVVHEDEEHIGLDKTWQEIHDAIASGMIAVVSGVSLVGASTMFINGAANDNNLYNVYLTTDSIGSPSFSATSANGYPEWV